MNYNRKNLSDKHSYYNDILHFQKLYTVVLSFLVFAFIIGYFTSDIVISSLLSFLKTYMDNLGIIALISILLLIIIVISLSFVDDAGEVYSILIYLVLFYLVFNILLFIFSMFNNSIVQRVIGSKSLYTRRVHGFYPNLFIFSAILFGFLILTILANYTLQLVYEKYSIPKYLETLQFATMGDLRAAIAGNFRNSHVFYKAKGIGTFKDQDEFFFFKNGGFKSYDEFETAALNENYNTASDYYESKKFDFPNSSVYYEHIPIVKRYQYPSYQSYLDLHDELISLGFESFIKYEQLRDLIIQKQYPSITEYEKYSELIENMAYPDYPTFVDNQNVLKKYELKNWDEYVKLQKGMKKYQIPSLEEAKRTLEILDEFRYTNYDQFVRHHHIIEQYEYPSYSDFERHHNELMKYGFPNFQKYNSSIEELKRLGFDTYNEYLEIIPKMKKYGFDNRDQYLNFWAQSKKLDRELFEYILKTDFRAKPLKDILKDSNISPPQNSVIEHVCADQTFTIHKISEIGNFQDPDNILETIIIRDKHVDKKIFDSKILKCGTCRSTNEKSQWVKCNYSDCEQTYHLTCIITQIKATGKCSFCNRHLKETEYSKLIN